MNWIKKLFSDLFGAVLLGVLLYLSFKFEKNILEISSFEKGALWICRAIVGLIALWLFIRTFFKGISLGINLTIILIIIAVLLCVFFEPARDKILGPLNSLGNKIIEPIQSIYEKICGLVKRIA